MKVESPVLPATALFWQPRPRQAELVVVVKASFELAPGRGRLASQQEPLVERDQHWNDDPNRFLVAASDWVPAKRGVDVVYVGRLLGPGSGRMRVGSIDKSVEARPDRWSSLGPLPLERRGPPVDVAWARAWSTHAMPEGVTTEVFNAAPADQRLAELAQDAEIHLENLEPIASLRCSLPSLRPIADVDLGAGPRRLPLRADTLTIDGERALVSVVWRGAMTVESPSSVRGVTISLDASAPAQSVVQGSAVQGTGHVPTANPGGVSPSQARAMTARTALPSIDPLANEALPFGPGSDASSPLAMRPANRGAPQGTPWGAPNEAPRTPPSWGAVGPTADRAPPALARPAAPQHLAAQHVPGPGQGPTHWPTAGQMAPPVPVAVPVAVPQAVPVARPPEASLHHASIAALGGAATASNAAVAAPPTATSAGSPAAPLQRMARASNARGLRFLWHDEESVLRIRRAPGYKSVLRKRERVVPERRHSIETADGEAAAEVLAILREVESVRELDLGLALERGFDDEGHFEADIVRLDGTLVVALDETELLAALTSTMAPFSKQDEEVGRAVDAASAFLESARRVTVPEIAGRLSESLRVAWGQWASRPLPAAEIDELASRAVLERRAYRKKDLLGGFHLRATLTPPGSTTSHTAYLPEACAKSLPLFLRFGVRTLCEVHPKEDATEASSSALRVVALARTIDEPPTP